MNASEQLPEFPHLPRAPITEAVIDFRAKLPDGFVIEGFRDLQSKLGGDFTSVEELKGIQLHLQFGAPHAVEVPSRKDLGVAGYCFRSADGKNIAQFRRDGFTLSRLAPYTSWEDVFAQAARLWMLYAETATPIDVPRIAVRYINRILVPQPLSDLSKYLTALPVLPKNWPNILSGFLTKVVIHDPASALVANVAQALESPADERHVPVLLDIGVSEQIMFDGKAEASLSRFEKLRQLKNRIFFSSLTEEAINLFR